MKNNQIKWLKARVFLIFSLLLLCFILIFLRALQLQVLDRDTLQGMAEKQHQRIIKLVPRRGTIYDRNLRVLAESAEIESLYAHPSQVKNVSRVAHKLARILEMDRSTIERRLRSSRSFVWLRRKIPPQKVDRIRGLGVAGSNFLKESQRYYPNVGLAANLLGFVGVDSQGLEGMELQYDRYLRGNPHRVVVELDARGREIVTEVPIPPTDLPSHSVVLTIDRDIQYIVERALSQAVSKTRAKSGMAVVMDPRTGQVLAVANRPSFNPNALKDYDPDSIRNRAITDIFEPGSIFKVFLLATALEEGAVQKNDIFFCHNGAYRIGREIIHDHKKYGWLSVQNIIKVSSNIGASQIGLKVGAKRLDRYIRNFGFGARTGIRLPGEVKGIVRNPNRLTKVDIANCSFGQGISVTGIQLISALSSIANGGILMRPHVVDRIIDQDGKVIQSVHPRIRRRVHSPDTSLAVTQILKEVVQPGGTGAQAALVGYEVAGKTGTAQKIDPLLKKYSDDKYVGSFMGFVPADDPRLAILVVIDEPEGTPYGGVVAAPVFRTIAQKTLQHLNVPPRKGTVIVHVRRDREGSRMPKKRETFAKGTRVQSEGVMPNLLGLSMRATLKWLEEMNLDIRISGRGVLLEQTPRPGSRLKKGTVCHLRFAPQS